MATDYNKISKEYQASKLAPWRKHVEAYSFFKLAGDVTGKKVLDLACGEGFYTRQLKLRGALEVDGVDISKAMIDLARESEAQQPLGIHYYEQDVQFLDLPKKYDLITASYLLNYAMNPKELGRFASAISKHLNPGGRFITINSNPDFNAAVAPMRKYGFTRENKSFEEGGEIIYRFFRDDDSYIDVINYHLEKTTHNLEFKRAGLSQVQWSATELSPEGIQEFGKEFWEFIINTQPVVGFSCVKRRNFSESHTSHIF